MMEERKIQIHIQSSATVLYCSRIPSKAPSELQMACHIGLVSSAKPKKPLHESKRLKPKEVPAPNGEFVRAKRAANGIEELDYQCAGSGACCGKVLQGLLTCGLFRPGVALLTWLCILVVTLLILDKIYDGATAVFVSGLLGMCSGLFGVALGTMNGAAEFCRSTPNRAPCCTAPACLCFGPRTVFCACPNFRQLCGAPGRERHQTRRFPRQPLPGWRPANWPGTVPEGVAAAPETVFHGPLPRATNSGSQPRPCPPRC